MQIDHEAISRNIKLEAAALSSFMALLRDEQHSLVRGENERLAMYAEAKATRVFELARLGNTRQELLRQHGYAPDRAGMERLLSEHAPAAAQAPAAWRQLLALTAEAHRLNELNGTLIAARLRSTQQALNVLLTAARIPGAYASDGSTVAYRTAHELAVA